MSQPMIALTFDDGPNTVITPLVLDILKENDAVGTFFLIAQNITPESAEMVRRAVAQGCDIENHSLTHGFMDKMTAEEIRAEVKACTEQIVAITGREPQFFRPPFIAVNQAMYDNIDLTFICGGLGCLLHNHLSLCGNPNLSHQSITLCPLQPYHAQTAKQIRGIIYAILGLAIDFWT